MKKIELKKYNEIIYYDKCDNGLSIYMWVNERVSNFYATLSVNYGSIDTKFKLKGSKKQEQVPNGIAHFLEHVNFNEGPNKTAHDYFNKLGSSINAFTTFNYTSYEVYASNNLKENIEHLLDYVEKPYFTKELVEKEKGIIVEEVKMGQNQPSNMLYYSLNKALFHKDNHRNYITGTEKEVNSITAEDLKLVFDTFYHPMNMFITVTGNFNPYEVATIIKENQSKKQFSKYRYPVVIYDKEDVSVVKKYQEIEGNVSIPKLKIGYKISKSKFKGLSDYEIRAYTRIILNANFGTTSDLRAELLEKELITMLSATADIIGDEVVYIITCETKYPSEIVKIIKEKINTLSITKNRLERRKKCNIADRIYGFDDIEYMNSQIQYNIINYHKILDNTYNDLKALNIIKAREVINIMKSDNCSVVILKPKE